MFRTTQRHRLKLNGSISNHFHSHCHDTRICTIEHLPEFIMFYLQRKGALTFLRMHAANQSILQAFPMSCPSSGTSTPTPLARSFVVCVRSSPRRPPTPTSWPSSPSPWSATWPSVGPSMSFLSLISKEPPSSPLSVGPLPCLPASPTSSSPSRLHTKDKVFTFNSGSTSSPSPIPTDPQHQSLPFVPCWTYQRYSCWFLFYFLYFVLQWYPVHEISFIVFFLVPVLLLAFLYVSMVIVIRRAAKTNLRQVQTTRLVSTWWELYSVSFVPDQNLAPVSIDWKLHLSPL